ncbi:MAG: Gfo/Idh/MocA family oxidoreductase [Pseudomonadales bacterium]|nr:Gfo/Idh/MocA family oxidoreductase [Pseudomonadales bacterium]NIX08403.1 Gfo/Idh/MocA family oxidoreductase [Pseudomonadales bacterium]
MTVRWGILATGVIARTFAQAVQQSGTGRLQAVGSRRRASAETFARAFDVPSAHGSYGALVDDPDVDAVYVAGPHPDHAQWSIRALRAGKAVLCEKPAGLNHAEVMAIIDEAQQCQKFFMEAFMYRCHPQTLRLVELLRDGAIGEVRHIEARFGFHADFDPASRLFDNALAGGGIMDVGCYPVSMARLIADAEPEEVSGHGKVGTSGVDEWASALLKFSNGLAAQVASSVSLSLDNSVRLNGSAGQIIVKNPWHCADAEGRWGFQLRRPGRGPEMIEGTAPPLYVIEADHVTDMIAQGQKESPRMSWTDSRNNALVLDAWRQGVGVEFQQETTAAPLLGGPLGRPERPPMTYGQVANLSKPVARLVMGCDNQPSLSHAAIMWDHYFERGGNAFDTAYIYGGGSMEKLLGRWHTSRGVRDEIVIIGKGAHTPDNRPEAVSRQLDRSLDRLQTDRVDVYFLHRDNTDIPVGEFVSALTDEANRGRISAFGGSNWTLERVQAANAYAADNGLQPFTALSNHFSLARMVQPIWPGVEAASGSPFRDFLADSQIALFPWSSQARGFFTPWADPIIAEGGTENRVVTAMQPTIAELKRTWFAEDNFERRERAGTLAERLDVEMINIALAYVLSQPFPCFPLIGPRLPWETRSCLAALKLALSTEEMAWLDLSDDGD